MKRLFSLTSACFAAALLAAGCVGPIARQHHGGHNLPPAERLMHPGPGVGGPGPGVIHPPMMPMAAPGPQVGGLSQVLFSANEGMQIQWDTTGDHMFDGGPLVTPGRLNLPQGGIYRFKLSNIPGKEGVELYPTVEIGVATPRISAFLQHNAIPVQFTPEDIDQVLTGNFVTKVIYLPDPEFQDQALAGVDTLVSTRLAAGVDPIVEADRRGAILAILRVGNKDEQLPTVGGGEMVEGGQVMPARYADPGSAAPNGSGPAAGQPVPGMPGHAVAPGHEHGAMGPAYMGHGHPHAAAGMPANIGPFGTPMPQHVAGVTAPHWGMPMTGTPIGLPGPPHIPLGGPAGLRKHVIRNHTKMHLPQPTEKIRVDVKQHPGFSYPHPADRVKIYEQSIHPSPHLHQPHGNTYQFVK